MARLPWLIRTRFESLGIFFSDKSRKQIFRDILGKILS